MKSILCFLLFFISFGILFSQSKGSPLLDSIAKTIRSKENLSIEWQTSFMYGKKRVDDTHSAKIKRNKYLHNTKSMIIICDSIMVYRENKESKEVIISNCDTTVNYNPIRVLTFFGNGYEVKKIRKHRSGKIGSIRIKTIDPLANLIKEAIIYFDEPGTLQFIEFKTKRKFSNYVKIKKLDSTTILQDSEFEMPK